MKQINFMCRANQPWVQSKSSLEQNNQILVDALVDISTTIFVSQFSKYYNDTFLILHQYLRFAPLTLH